MGNRFHIAPQNALFVVYGIIKVTLLKNIRRKYWKVFENLLTNREHSVILCTKKTRAELKFGYFSLGFTV